MLWFMYFPLCIFAELFGRFPMAFLCPLSPSRWPLWETPDQPLSGHHWKDVKWLLRNAAYGFKLYIIGCPHDPDARVIGNPKIKNRGDAIPGWLLMRSGPYWYLKFVLPLGLNYCLQWAFGWQLDAPINGRCLFMFSPRFPTRYFPKG